MAREFIFKDGTSLLASDLSAPKEISTTFGNIQALSYFYNKLNETNLSEVTIKDANGKEEKFLNRTFSSITITSPPEEEPIQARIVLLGPVLPDSQDTKIEQLEKEIYNLNNTISSLRDKAAAYDIISKGEGVL